MGPPRTPVHNTLINALGIPAAAGCAAAIRQHVLDRPAPVVATAATTTRLARQSMTGRHWHEQPAREQLSSSSVVYQRTFNRYAVPPSVPISSPGSTPRDG